MCIALHSTSIQAFANFATTPAYAIADCADRWTHTTHPKPHTIPLVTPHIVIKPMSTHPFNPYPYSPSSCTSLRLLRSALFCALSCSCLLCYSLLRSALLCSFLPLSVIFRSAPQLAASSMSVSRRNIEINHAIGRYGRRTLTHLHLHSATRTRGHPPHTRIHSLSATHMRAHPPNEHTHTETRKHRPHTLKHAFVLSHTHAHMPRLPDNIMLAVLWFHGSIGHTTTV